MMIHKIVSLMTDALAAGVKLEALLRQHERGAAFQAKVAAASAAFRAAIAALPGAPRGEWCRTVAPVSRLIEDCEYRAVAVLVGWFLRRLANTRSEWGASAPPIGPAMAPTVTPAPSEITTAA